MPPRVPERLLWAVGLLAPRPGDRILEVGCGRGVVVDLVADRLTNGRVTGIDRSPVAIAAAGARNRGHLHAGRARLLTISLADVDFGKERFDAVLAINVNVFWLGPARELDVIRRHLAPTGRLHLFYEPPSDGQLERIAAACSRHLREHAFEVREVVRTELAPHPGLCIVAAPAG